MARHEDPAQANFPKQSADLRHARGVPGPTQDKRRLGAAVQLAALHRTLRDGPVLQLEAGRSAAGARPAAANRTGLPDRLKSGVEALSGLSLDAVRVYYNSARPAQLNAHAYAQGTDIHLAPGQEAHLPHEAWHVVQQAQGRVRPTLQMKEGVSVNDDAGLEREADVMGARASAGAARGRESGRALSAPAVAQRREVIQRARKTSDILNIIDQNPKALGPVTGIHTKRLMYWNDKDVFDKKLDLKAVQKAMAKKIPIETEKVEESKLPEFMQVRSDFSAVLPKTFGGGKLWFRKKPENAVMQNRQGWISDNIYWSSEKKKKYMIHSILGWNKDKKPVDEPEPHVTLRNVETQVNIDLDITNPLPSKEARIKSEMEVTRTSFSRGLKGERKPGESMDADEGAFDQLKGDTTKTWLEALIKTAQGALNL